MTKDKIKRSKGNFNPVTETREWHMAASEDHCRRISRNIGKRLIEIIDLEEFIPVFNAISDRNWLQFKELERKFAGEHGVETWADVLNFRIMPALEPDAKRWLLIQRCSQGIKSVKNVLEDENLF